jgi:hypothetical protein
MSARFEEGANMRLRALAATAIVPWLLMPLDARAGAPDLYKSLVNGAFFSEACRQRAAGIGLSETTNVDVVLSAIAAFGRRLKPGVPEVMLDDACEVPAILLVNLLRSNGVDAEIVLVARRPRDPSDGSSEKLVQRIYVYIPKYDRYLDPEISIGKQRAVDAILREEMVRSHFQGPSIGDDSGNTCADVCLMVLGASPMAARRAKTERIRGPLSDATK